MQNTVTHICGVRYVGVSQWSDKLNCFVRCEILETLKYMYICRYRCRYVDIGSGTFMGYVYMYECINVWMYVECTVYMKVCRDSTPVDATNSCRFFTHHSTHC